MHRIQPAIVSSVKAATVISRSTAARLWRALAAALTSLTCSDMT